MDGVDIATVMLATPEQGSPQPLELGVSVSFSELQDLWEQSPKPHCSGLESPSVVDREVAEFVAHAEQLEKLRQETMQARLAQCSDLQEMIQKLLKTIHERTQTILNLQEGRLTDFELAQQDKQALADSLRQCTVLKGKIETLTTAMATIRGKLGECEHRWEASRTHLQECQGTRERLTAEICAARSEIENLKKQLFESQEEAMQAGLDVAQANNTLGATEYVVQTHEDKLRRASLEIADLKAQIADLKAPPAPPRVEEVIELSDESDNQPPEEEEHPPIDDSGDEEPSSPPSSPKEVVLRFVAIWTLHLSRHVVTVHFEDGKPVRVSVSTVHDGETESRTINGWGDVLDFVNTCSCLKLAKLTPTNLTLLNTKLSLGLMAQDVEMDFFPEQYQCQEWEKLSLRELAGRSGVPLLPLLKRQQMYDPQVTAETTYGPNDAVKWHPEMHYCH